MPVLKENTIFANRYELLKFLGEGGFAEVWLAKDSLTETEVAVKIFVPDGGLNDEIIGSFKKEFAITLNLNHSHLLKYLHFDIYNKSPYLVMKYCSNGTLFKKIGNNLGEADVAKIMFQIGSALEYLHEMGVAHQDIKPENILTDEKGTYLLSDFGISIKTRNTLNRFTKQATEKSSYGSPPYAPPEKYGKNPKQNLEAGDIFALGVMLYEICEGDLPWGGKGGIALIMGAEVPEIDNAEFTNMFKLLIFRCMSVKPADRPTAAELKSKSEFFLKEGYWESKTIIKILQQEPFQSSSARGTARMPVEIDVPEITVNDKIVETKIPVIIEPQMIFVQGGSFKMGSNSHEPDEKPLHAVTVNDFYIGKYELTQKEWILVMGDNPSLLKGDDSPIVNISWYDVMIYCNRRSLIENLTPCYSINNSTNPSDWGIVPRIKSTIWDSVSCNWSANGYRLPTEAEWEYAAKGGNRSRSYIYAGSNELNTVGWFSCNSTVKAHSVGLKAPNEIGLYDISGNVWEWCWDWHDKFYYSNSTPIDPKGQMAGTFRILRGGCYNLYENSCRITYRGNNSAQDCSKDLGFRLARSK